MNLEFNVDVEEIAKTIGGMKEQVKSDITKSVEGLATMTHAKTLELADEELDSLTELYRDNISLENPAPNLWVVGLNMEKAGWIEEGRKSGFMEELLNGKSGKNGPNGRYAVIPFEHSKNPTQQSEKAQFLANQIKEALRKEEINWKKIEKGPDGSPRLGRLHTINVNIPRLSEKHKSSPGMGVSVYQSIDKETGGVRRDVLTFRIIHEKHRGEGLWMHPGRSGNKIMDKAFEWAEQVWENEILPSIFKKYKSE